jgi:hypothetical protein
MRKLQATWTPDRSLFFWVDEGDADEAIESELPSLQRSEIAGTTKLRAVAVPMEGKPRRRRVKGFDVEIASVIPLLAAIPQQSSLSAAIRCWSLIAKLGLELAANQRVVPTVLQEEASWKALLTRPQDRKRFDAMVRSMPIVARCVPTSQRGKIRLHTNEVTARSFLDATTDALYRQSAYPGTTRGWALEFADALRSDESRAFSPRDARYQGIPELLSSWSNEAESTGLRLGMELSLPQEGSGEFPVSFRLFPVDAEQGHVSVDDAWTAGPVVEVGGRSYAHPANAALRHVARAARIYPPLAAALHGSRPQSLNWDAKAVWRFLDDGVELLREAGFGVRIPLEFATAGRQRIRARMRVVAEHDPSAPVPLSDVLRFRWEVTLGDMVLDGADFGELLDRRDPVVHFRGQWVLLDPKELARLPDGIPKEGEIPRAKALRAVLTGQLDGIPVVADTRLDLALDALKSPSEQPIPPGLNGSLRPYQHRGFSWLTALGQLGLGCCLADDMGLGKTIQLICHLLHRQGGNPRRPSLVICPTSVLGNWARELDKFAPTLTRTRYHGLQRDLKEAAKADVVLTTYGLLVRDQDILSEIEWDIVTLDEAQAIKNPDSQRARAARRIRSRHRVALSGTPIENRLDELWALMEFLVPGFLGPRAVFRRQVAVPIERFGDREMARRLKLGVTPFLLRRVKTDPTVIDDLPEKFERRVYCTLTPEQATLYEQVVDDAMGEISGSSEIERRGRILAMLTALKQVCNHPSQYLGDDSELAFRSGKLDRCVDLLDAVFELNERVLIFTQYREMGYRLQRHIRTCFGDEAPFLHGGSSPSTRDEMVRAFQEDDDVAPVLIISLRAGGTGLNLTRATHVIHYDRWWNPAVEDQATDRAYRIGQRDNVSVHKMVCQGSLEERIDELLEEKRALAESVVGSGERWVTELDDDALRRLVALSEDAVVEGDD